MDNVEGRRGKAMLWLMKSTLGILHALMHRQALLVVTITMTATTATAIDNVIHRNCLHSSIS